MKGPSHTETTRSNAKHAELHSIEEISPLLSPPSRQFSPLPYRI